MSWWGSHIDLVSTIHAEGTDPTLLGCLLRTGAELATLESRALQHESQNEIEQAASCWAELARKCIVKKLRHDSAIRYAMHALSLRNNPALREDLTQWLEGIGAWNRAAELVAESGEPANATERTRWHRRLAGLFWRAGSLEQAAQSLAEIARLDAECTEPLELLAGIHSSAPEVVSRERAVLAQLEAARRYQQRGARLSAFEAELRAFEIDPSSILATEQLAVSLGKLGRRQAAEEIWRVCAKLTADKSLHNIQIEKALSHNEVDRALGSALDAMADVMLSLNAAVPAAEYALQPVGAIPKTFDAILARARLFGWLAARLEIALVEARAADQTRTGILLARMFASAMGRPELAAQSLQRALISDPMSTDVRRMLEVFSASSGDPSLLTIALVDALRAGPTAATRQQLAHEIVGQREHMQATASLVAWAVEALQQDPAASDLRATLGEFVESREQQRARLSASLTSCKQMDFEQRIQTLHQVAKAMAADPEALTAERDVLLEWLDVEPGSTLALQRLARLVETLSWQMPAEGSLQLWEYAFGLLSNAAGDGGVIAVASYWLRQGLADDARLVLEHALTKPEPSQRLLGWVVTLARRMADHRMYAAGLALLAKTTDSLISAALLAQAAEAYLEINDVDAARRVVDHGLLLQPTSARLVSTDVRLHEVKDSRALADTLERALGIIPPRAQFAYQLAEAHHNLGNVELALAWAQRASTLQPAAAPLRALVAQMAIAANDSARMAEWLIHSLDIPVAVSSWLPRATIVLHALVRADAPRAAEVVRRLMGATGVSEPLWRATMLSAADVVMDARLALDILERTVAAGCDVPETLQDIVRRRLKLGDFESAYEAALRALRQGVAADKVRNWVPVLFESESYQVAETELAAATLIWELAQHGTSHDESTRALRRLAKARFALAQDEPGAVQLWAKLVCQLGVDLVSIALCDLLPNLGHLATIRYLQLWGEDEADPERKAAMSVARAVLYAQINDTVQAQANVSQTLGLAPSNTAALGIAESLVPEGASFEWIDEIYALAANATLGMYGERALHYRAAKVLENKGDYPRALKHACRAFVALPGEGAAMTLAASLTRKAGDAQPFADAVWTIASQSKSNSPGSHWLLLAIDELEKSDAFSSTRFDLLLAALSVEPSVAVVRKTTQTLQRLLDAAPSEGEMASLRFAKVLRANLEGVRGPFGARLAIETAHAAVCLLDAVLCAQAIRRGFQSDAAIDEYGELTDAINWLCNDESLAHGLLADIMTDLEQPYINVDFSALQVLGILQLRAGDENSLHRLDDLVSRVGQRAAFLAWIGTALEHAPKNLTGFVPVVKELIQLRVQEGQLDDAVELLISIIRNAPRTTIAYDSARRAIELLLLHTDISTATRWLASVREQLTPVHSATLELELAQHGSEPLKLIQALSHRAYSDPSSPADGMRYLQQATTLADQLGYVNAALDCARSAVAWDPSHVGAQLHLATLIYKYRDRDVADDPEEIVAALRRLPTQHVPQNEELRAFLLAEALDAAQGSGAGTDELVTAHARFGPLPLIALGLAERLILTGNGASSLPFFQHAIAGDLRGLRLLANVCVEAARVARGLGELELALRWLERAMTEENCPTGVGALAAEIAEERQRRNQSVEPSVDISPVRDVDEIARPRRTASKAAALSNSASTTKPATDEDSVEIPLVRRRTDKPDSSRPKLQVSVPFAAVETEPETLADAVAHAQQMVERASPSYQTLTVLRRWLRRWPGSTKLMEYVRDAAFVERDIPLSRAVEHARGVILGLVEHIEPPDIAAQPIVPEAARALLAKDLTTPATDAAAMLWEGAEHLIQRDLLDYGVTGLDRVVPNMSNLLWQVASELSPRFDLMRTPIFHRKSAQPLSATVALASPTAVVLTGELPKEPRNLAGLLGSSLWITQPQYSLLMGAPAEQVRTVLLALQLAFGPPQKHQLTNMSASLRLAEKLWECIPSAAQRHLRELCHEPLDYQRASDHARLAQRRAALYATGDLHWALARLSEEEGSNVLADLADPLVADINLRVADLLRLATSAEYAAVRWQPVKGSEVRVDALLG